MADVSTERDSSARAATVSYAPPAFGKVTPAAAYSLLVTTIGAASFAFWEVFLETRLDPVRPILTVFLAGLSGSLAWVLTNEVKDAETRTAALLFRWLLVAGTGVGTSMLVFALASIAFGPREPHAFNYPGLGFLGAITGYLGSLMKGRQRDVPYLEPRSPIDWLNRDLSVQLPSVVEAIKPRLSRAVADAVLGPRIPSYEGYVAVELATESSRQLHGLSRFDLHVAFNTAPGPLGLVVPVSIRGRGEDLSSLAADTPAVPDGTATVGPTISVEILLHVPVSRESPYRRTLSVPLAGKSDRITFAVQFPTNAEEPQRVNGGLIPDDTYLEIRCAGLLVRTVDVSRLNR